jgi:hypothetical protein
MLLSLILPLCIRMGCGRRDYPKMRQPDIHFALTLVLNALVPPRKQHGGSISVGGQNVMKSNSMSMGEMGRTGSLHSGHGKQQVATPKELLQNVAFLGLKILVVCFDKQLSSGWHRIASVVSDYGSSVSGECGHLSVWSVQCPSVCYSGRSATLEICGFRGDHSDAALHDPAAVHSVQGDHSDVAQSSALSLLPQMMKSTCETEQEYFIQQNVHQKLQGLNLPHPRCKGSILVELAAEMRHLKEELGSLPSGEMRPRTSTMMTDRSDSSRASKRSPPASATGVTFARSSSIHDLLEQQMQTHLQTLVPTLSSRGRFSKGQCLPCACSSERLVRFRACRGVRWRAVAAAAAQSPGLAR